MNAYLLLANGMVFAGQSVGAQGVTVGEVVFATGMVGFQETLTDPSYYGQIITQTYPLIGNYGMNHDDMESDRIWAKGYIVREACTTPSNWRCEETLDSFLKKNNTIGIEGIDTRHLTRIIRESGVMNGAILTTFDPADPANKAAAGDHPCLCRDGRCQERDLREARGLSREGRDPHRADALRLQAQHRALPCQARLQGDGHARLCNGRGNQGPCSGRHHAVQWSRRPGGTGGGHREPQAHL